MELKLLDCNVFQGENNSRKLKITVDESYSGYEIRLAFLTPAGHRCITPEIELTNLSADYLLPYSLLDASGMLLAQIVAENNEGSIVKSDIFAIDVEKSVETDSPVEDGDSLITLAGLKARTDLLFEELENYALAEDIPTKTSELTNDSGFLTAHQDISGKADVSDLSGVAFSGDYGDLSNTPTVATGILGDKSTDAATNEFVQKNKMLWFAASSSAADSTVKEATIVPQSGLADDNGFTLHTGATVIVMFQYSNSASSFSLNVNETGAKNVSISAVCKWTSGSILAFTYNGSKWVLHFPVSATTSRAGIVALNSSTSSTSTSTAATPSAVKQAYDLANGKQSPATTKAEGDETTAPATNEFVQKNKLTWYAECDTPESTGEKMASVIAQNGNASSSFKLYKGATVFVKFKYSNSQAHPTLKVGNYQALDMKTSDNAAVPAYLWNAGQVCCFTFDGTYWILINISAASTTKHGVTKLYDGVDSSSTVFAATANSVKTVYNLANGKQDALPAFTSSDAGKVLGINAQGELEWVSLS